MQWNDESEQETAQYFETSYVLWAVGMLDPEVMEELDRLTPPGHENWRQIMERESPWPRTELQAVFGELCEVMSDDEALEIVLQRLAFQRDLASLRQR